MQNVYPRFDPGEKVRIENILHPTRYGVIVGDSPNDTNIRIFYMYGRLYLVKLESGEVVEERAATFRTDTRIPLS